MTQTEQQDTREQQIEALGLAIYGEKRLADRHRDTTARVYDEAVVSMIADAEQAALEQGYAAGRNDGWDAAAWVATRNLSEATDA